MAPISVRSNSKSKAVEQNPMIGQKSSARNLPNNPIKGAIDSQNARPATSNIKSSGNINQTT